MGIFDWFKKKENGKIKNVESNDGKNIIYYL